MMWNVLDLGNFIIVFLVFCGVIALLTKLIFWVVIIYQMFNGSADGQSPTTPSSSQLLHHCFVCS
mgnify:CR=1 FL=1